MEFSLLTALFIVLAYLLGSFSTAIVTCKIMGLQDPRSSGSNNPGATNVLRLGGKKAAIITLFGDMLKGFVPVIVASLYISTTLELALIGFFAFLGHVMPIYYRFIGGKGVATYYGVIVALNWQVGLIALAIWLAIATLVKISSLSALISIFCTPIILWYFTNAVDLSLIVGLMSLIVIIRHKSNIQLLLAGSENSIKKSPNKPDTD